MTRRIILLGVTCALCACDGKPKSPSGSAEKDRVEVEITRRVEAATTQLKLNERTARLKSIRIVGFVVLSLSAVGGLCWLLRANAVRIYPATPVSQRRPEWNDHFPPTTRRVIDPLPALPQPVAPRAPRRQGRQAPRSRKRTPP